MGLCEMCVCSLEGGEASVRITDRLQWRKGKRNGGSEGVENGIHSHSSPAIS